MIDRTYWTKSAGHGLGMLAVLALLVTTWIGAVTSVSAQANGGIVIGASLSCSHATECGPDFSVKVSVTTEGGEFLGACTVTGNLNDASHVPACSVPFPFRPSGTLIVTEDVSTLPAGYAPQENPMYVDTAQLGRASHDVVFQNVPQAGSANASKTSDVAIATDISGYPFIDACYVLVDFSNVGCDENGDGQVTFQEVPVGTYTVHQTEDLGPGRSVPDFVINVTGNASYDWEVFEARVITTSDNDRAGDIAIFTYENGQPAYDACYVLVGYSNEGCDENRDGRVMFADIPLGTYTVRQTADLGPGRHVPDFTIHVTGNVSSAGWEGFSATVSQVSGGAVPSGGAIDISLITRDPQTGGLLTDTCYVLVGYSNEGCDKNGDGQVTFADIPFGTYTVHQTLVPAGYPPVRDFEIEVEPTDYPTGFVVRQASEPNAPETRNVSVMLIDVATNTKVPLDACVQLVEASNVGCDDDLKDGQIDFLDVVAGQHDLVVTQLPAGYRVANHSDRFVEIDPGTDPANVFVYLYITRGGA